MIYSLVFENSYIVYIMGTVELTSLVLWIYLQCSDPGFIESKDVDFLVSVSSF